MRKLWLVLVLLTSLLAGCDSGNKEGEQASPQKSAVEKSNSNSGNLTVLDLKKKYGAAEDKAIMPFYNVPQDKEFRFNFKADLSSSRLQATDLITVHTNIKAEDASKILALSELDKNTVSIKPLGWGVLSTETSEKKYQSSWGGAPVYYLRVNYDMDSPELTKLEKPIIIPFTVKSELPVPNVRYDILPDGRFKLEWDKVEGAESYKIYNRQKYTLLETANRPLKGAEEGYVGQLPLVVKEIKDTEFMNFMNGTKDGLPVTTPGLISYENQMVGGEYYVTAVAGSKESNFSNGVSTVDLSSQLPTQMKPSLSFETFETLAVLPKTVQVEFIDGSIAAREVVYDTSVPVKEDGDTELKYTVKGTAFAGYVIVRKVTAHDLEGLVSGQVQGEVSGTVEPRNDTPYVPAPEVPTVIGDAPGATSSETPSETPSEMPSESPSETPDAASTDNVVDAQKDNTKKKVDEGNKGSVPTPDTVQDVKVNADSALEEYLALSMMNADADIPLEAFPEAQNFETITDVMKEAMYQNPLILGVKGWSYSYETLTLSIKYDDSTDSIKDKQKQIVTEAKKIVSTVIKADMSADEKHKAIYDYLNDNTKYDDAALADAEAKNYQDVDSKFADSFNTYGIMVKKVGVCASYASTYKLLGDLAGIETIVVTGDMSGVPHAWNKVKLSNGWVHVDSTNNGTNSGVPYLLYDASDATAKSLNYTLSDEFWVDSEIAQFAATDDSKEYYLANDLVVKTAGDFGSKLSKQVKEGKNSIVIRYSGKIDQNALVEEAGKALRDLPEDKLAKAELGSLSSYIIVKY